MPLFGCHMSIAGGYHNALTEAQAHDCDTVQLFVSQPKTWPVKPASRDNKRSGQGWQAKEIPAADVALFRRTLRRAGLRLPLAHASYLINLASPDDGLHRQSIEAFIVELQRTEQLGIRYLVVHPGAHIHADEDTGLKRVALALDEVHARCPGFGARVLLEATAGQGTSLGHRFEHLARILELMATSARVGVCVDTCHLFAAGYALAPVKEYRATFRVFDKIIGLRKLLAFHLNDSLKPLGSRVDRHAHIGQGCLGLEPFRLLVNDRRFRNRPMVLETPKEDDMDAVNLQTLRGLVAAHHRAKS